MSFDADASSPENTRRYRMKFMLLETIVLAKLTYIPAADSTGLSLLALLAFTQLLFSIFAQIILDLPLPKNVKRPFKVIQDQVFGGKWKGNKALNNII